MGGRQGGYLVRKNARLWARRLGAILIAGIFVGLAVTSARLTDTKSSQLHVAAGCGSRRARLAQVASHSSSPVPTVQVAHGVLTPAVRDMKPTPGHWNMMFREVGRALAGREFRSFRIGTRAARSSSAAPRRTRCRAPIANFAGREQRQRRLAAGHRGRHRPEPLHAVGQPRLPDLPSRRDAGRHRHAGQSLFGRQPVRTVSAADNDGDPIVLYDQFADRWLAAQLAYAELSERAVLPVRRGLVARTIRPEPGARYQYVACPTNKLNDYPKFGVWPTQNAYMITVNQFSEPGDGWAGVGVIALRAGRDDQRLRPRTDALQGHVPGRTEPLGRHASGGRSTARRCRLRMPRRR